MSPRSEEQVEEIRKKSIEKIKDAAMELFAEDGFSSATMTSIAKKAGVSKGLIYNYFKNKEEILDEIINMLMGMFKVMMTEFKKIEDPKEALKSLLHMSLLMYKDDEKMFKLISFIMMQKSVVDKYTELFKGFYHSFIDILTEIFTRMNIENPEFEARSLSAIIDGLQFHMVYVGGDLKIEEMVQFIEKRYIDREETK